MGVAKEKVTKFSVSVKEAVCIASVQKMALFQVIDGNKGKPDRVDFYIKNNHLYPVSRELLQNWHKVGLVTYR